MRSNQPVTPDKVISAVSGASDIGLLPYALGHVFRHLPLMTFDHAAYTRMMHAYVRHAAAPYSLENTGPDLASEFSGIKRYSRIATRMLVPAISAAKVKYLIYLSSSNDLTSRLCLSSVSKFMSSTSSFVMKFIMPPIPSFLP